MPRRSVACPFVPGGSAAPSGSVAVLASCAVTRNELRLRAEEAAATNSEAVRAAAVEQVASRNESAMQPCADGSHAVTKRQECESVGNTRATKSAATRHRRAQGVQRPFQCDTCQKKLSSKSHLKAHISAFHEKEKPHECKRCGKSFLNASHLHVHIRSYTGERPFECKVRFCRTRAAVAQYLRHVRSHGMGCDSEPEEAAATNSEAVRAAAVEQVASRNESAMQPCADGSRAVTKRQECESVGNTRATKSAATRHRRAQGVQRPFQCDTCQKKFSRKGHLKAHISAVHIKEKPHKCKWCGKSFTKASHLHVHIRSHTGERPFECEVCGKRFSDSSSLTTHSRVHTGEKPFECKVCGKRFSDSSGLTKHLRLHTGEKPFQCKVCGKRFSDSSSLTTHSRVHTGEKPFECKVCGKRFSVNSSLTTHSRLHTGEKPFQCKVCGKRFAVNSSLTTHSRLHTGEKPFQCKVCGRRFNQVNILTTHSRLHTGEKPFQCKVCGRRFNQANILTTHSRLHTEKKAVSVQSVRQEIQSTRCVANIQICCTPLIADVDNWSWRFCRTRAAVAQYLRHVRSHGMGCDSEPEEAAATNSEAVRAAAVEQVASRNESAMQPCADGSRAVTKRQECESVGNTRATKSAATRHRRAQGVQRPFQCDTCQKKFSRKSHLKAHMSAVHTKKKNHEVQVVYGKSFAKASHLHVHIRSHTGERPFECKVCGKRFSHSSNLIKHFRLHSGEKPFVCKVCGKKFNQSSSLSRHSRLHTGEKPFECKVCGKRFVVNNSLTKHSRLHTGEKPYECKVCGRRFSVSCSLIAHSRVHTGEKPFKCKVCGKRFSVNGNLIAHSGVHTGEKPFQRKVCDKKFSQVNNLKRHYQQHMAHVLSCSCAVAVSNSSLNVNESLVVNNQFLLSYEPISQSFLQNDSKLKNVGLSSQLAFKIRLRDGSSAVTKRHECGSVGKTRATKSAATRHRRAEGVQRPIQCDTCQKKFSRKKHLKAHSSAVHEKAKPHECKRCGKSFSGATHFHGHIRSHTGERPFQCKVCNRIFSVSCNLTTYLRLHTVEKPFECMSGGKRLNQGSSLKEHSKQHTLCSEYSTSLSVIAEVNHLSWSLLCTKRLQSFISFFVVVY
uniref:Gastrula zinc finger protein XlCGF57.1-like n=1 Tax=Macrostomum lignano TaxID=282301 RepID=A0A1I8GPV8_9PLAT